MTKKKLLELIDEMMTTITAGWARIDNVIEYYAVNNDVILTGKEEAYVLHKLARKLY